MDDGRGFSVEMGGWVRVRESSGSSIGRGNIDGTCDHHIYCFRSC